MVSPASSAHFGQTEMWMLLEKFAVCPFLLSSYLAEGTFIADTDKSETPDSMTQE